MTPPPNPTPTPGQANQEKTGSHSSVIEHIGK